MFNCCIIWCRCKKCKYCNEIIKTASFDYCNEICEFHDIYQDSFRLSDSSNHKYIYDLSI